MSALYQSAKPCRVCEIPTTARLTDSRIRGYSVPMCRRCQAASKASK